jgi:septal ring factor EnvC (AmiA/AmiB activator)
MGFMDKLKEAAQDVATEAKKATAQGKTKLDQMQSRKKADDAAKQLGYLVHAERTKGATPGGEADRLIAELTRLEIEIAAEAEGEPAETPAATGQAPDAPGSASPQPPPASAPHPPAAPPPASSDPTPGDSKR